jgi:predicted ABC-type ATPase
MMIVVAGPSGSGKSTRFPVDGFGIDSFNVDDRCAHLVGGYAHITPTVRRAAGLECERFIREHIDGRRSFATETTLRTSISIEQAALARTRGFLTIMKYVAAPSADESVRRVLQRAIGGGHGAPETQIRKIYESSTANLSHAIRVFDIVECYSSPIGWPWPDPVLVAQWRDGVLTLHANPAPAWLVSIVTSPNGEEG